MRIAVIHDWLTGMRGGEKVLKHVLRLYPEADVFTLFWKHGSVHPGIESRVTATSFLDKLPWKGGMYRYYLPLFPFAVEAFDLTDYDLIISISHCVAKGVITPPDSVHVSYVLTPMRYAWVLGDEYFGPGRVQRPLRALLSPVLSYLRVWDAASSERVDHFLADSRHVNRRIEKFYRRQGTVVYPPVDIDRFSPTESREDYYLYLGSFAPYKRADLAIEACRRNGRTLYLVGSGQDEKRLRRLAAGDPTIRFLGWLEDSELASCLSRARALLFPGEEDFGMVPVEALASGTPVLAYARGGALETVMDEEEQAALVDARSGMPRFRSPVAVSGGVLFPSNDVSSIIRGMKLVEEAEFDHRLLRNLANRFHPDVFAKRFREEITLRVDMPRDGGC